MKKIIGIIGIVIGVILIGISLFPIALSCEGANETAYADTEATYHSSGRYEWYIGQLQWYKQDLTGNHNGRVVIRTYVNYTSENTIDYYSTDLVIEDPNTLEIIGEISLLVEHTSATTIDGLTVRNDVIPLSFYNFADPTKNIRATGGVSQTGGVRKLQIQLNSQNIPGTTKLIDIQGINASQADGWQLSGYTSYNLNVTYPGRWWGDITINEEITVEEAQTPLNMLKGTVNDLLDVPIFGEQFNFGTIIKLTFGLLLIGVCIKLFLGG